VRSRHPSAIDLTRRLYYRLTASAAQRIVGIRKNEPNREGLSSGDGRFNFIGANELVTLHSDGYLKLGAARNGRLHAPQDLAKTTDSDGGMTTGEGDEIFDLAANFDVSRRNETNTTGTDIPGSFDSIHSLIAELEYLQGQLQLIPLRTSFFQVLTL
jgi:hypothetical protein